MAWLVVAAATAALAAGMTRLGVPSAALFAAGARRAGRGADRLAADEVAPR
ncbi:MAG: hypothetical protein PGN11_20800 [Quadrisphaera sp.]